MLAALCAAGSVLAADIAFANDPFPPYVIGQMNALATDGIALRLHREILRRVDKNAQATYQLMPWARALQSVKQGELDAMMFLFRTPEREQIYDYSQPLLTTPLVVFYSKKRLANGLAWQDIKDLAKYESVATRSASYGDLWDNAVRDGILKPHLVASPLQTILMTAHARVDFTPMNLYTGIYLIREHGLEDLVAVNETPLHQNAYHMAFSKKSQYRHLLPAIDKAIDELRAEQFAEKLLKNWKFTTAPKN